MTQCVVINAIAVGAIADEKRRNRWRAESAGALTPGVAQLMRNVNHANPKAGHSPINKSVSAAAIAR